MATFHHEPSGPFYGPAVGILGATVWIQAGLNAFGSGLCKIMFGKDCFPNRVPDEVSSLEPHPSVSTSTPQPTLPVEAATPVVLYTSSAWQDIRRFLIFIAIYCFLIFVQSMITRLLSITKNWKLNALYLRNAKLEQTVISLLQRSADLERQIRGKDLEIMQLTDEKAKLHSNSERIESALRSFEQQVAGLQSNRNAENIARMTIERQVKALENEVIAEKSQKEAFQGQLATLSQLKAESDQKLQASQKQLTDLSNAKQKPLHDLERQKSSAEKRVKTYESQAARFVQLKKSLEDQNSVLKSEMNDLKLNELGIREQVSGLQMKIRAANEESESQKARYNGLLSEKDARIKELQKPSEQIDTTIVKQLEREIQDLNSQISTANESRKAAMNEIVALKADRDDATRAVKSLEYQSKALEKLEADAQTTIRSEEAAREDAKALRSQLAAMEEKLHSCQDALTKSVSDNKEQQKMLEGTQTERLKEKRAWEQQVLNLHNDKEQAMQGYSKVQGAYESLQKAKAVVDEGAQKLAQQVQSNRQKSQKAYDEQAQEVNRLQSIIDQMKVERDSLHGEVNELKSWTTQTACLENWNGLQSNDNPFALFTNEDPWVEGNLVSGTQTLEEKQAADAADWANIDHQLGFDTIDQPPIVPSIAGNDPTPTETSTASFLPAGDLNQGGYSFEFAASQIDFIDLTLPSMTDPGQTANPNPTIGDLPSSEFSIPGLGPMASITQLNTPQVPEVDLGGSLLDPGLRESGKDSEPRLQTMVSTTRDDRPFMNPFHGRPMRRPVVRGHQKQSRGEDPAASSHRVESQDQPQEGQAIQSQSHDYGPAFVEEDRSAEIDAAFNNPNLETTVATPKEYLTTDDRSDSSVEAENDGEESTSSSDDYEKPADFEEEADDFLHPFNTAKPGQGPETVTLQSPKVKGENFEGTGPDPETANLSELDLDLLGENEQGGKIGSSSASSDDEQELTDTEIDAMTDAEVDKQIEKKKAELEKVLQKRAEKERIE